MKRGFVAPQTRRSGESGRFRRRNPGTWKQRPTALAICTALTSLTLAGCGSSGPAQSSGTTTAACNGNYAKPSQVSDAYQVGLGGDNIVKTKGWLERDLPGVKVNWNEFNSGAEANTALAAGSADFGLVGTSPVATGLASGIDYQVVWIYDLIGTDEALIVKSNKGINTVSDLVGKKVATPFASTSHYSLLSALKINGVDPNKVTILDLQPNDALAAWQRGDIDAAYVWNPVHTKMVNDGGKVLLTSADMAAKGYPTGDLAVVRTAFANQYPCVVRVWLRDEASAVDVQKSQPDQFAAGVAAENGITLDAARAYLTGFSYLTGKEMLTPNWLGTKGHPGHLASVLYSTGQFLFEQKSIGSVPSKQKFDNAVNPSYLQDALPS